MGPGSGHLGYLLDCCALIDFDQCADDLLRVLAATLPVATTRLVAGEWPAIDEPRCAALGLSIVDESEAQLVEIAIAHAGLSVADRSAMILARDGPYILVTNDKALHRIGGSSGVTRAWGPDLLPLLVASGVVDRRIAVAHVRTMQARKAGSTQAMTAVFIRSIRRSRARDGGHSGRS